MPTTSTPSESNDLKNASLATCRRLLEEKTALLQDTLADIRDSISNDTKSTAGDKHETSRAHLQISQEQAARQLVEVHQQKAVLDGLRLTDNPATIMAGTLIKTSAGIYLLSTAIGRMQVLGEEVIALSPQSPLGSRMLGRSVGDEILMNNRSIRILSIH